MPDTNTLHGFLAVLIGILAILIISDKLLTMLGL